MAMDLQLTPIEVRVLGSLVEKSVTTPEYYPLTLNALAAACNQKSNRDPVMQCDEKEIVRALDSLRDRGLAWSVTVTGNRVPKYRHRLADALPLNPIQMAVLCELMVRGPQTAGELKTHAGRMVAFPAGTEAQSVLDELCQWAQGPLAYKLPRQAGQREERYAQRLSGEVPIEPPAVAPVSEPARRIVMAENERVAALENRLAAMQAELDQLKAQFADFQKQFQ
jgi:hypothetical protein